uniref:Uncharacterized protein n=1 Tax=Coccidioides posadasii RMSCC 3488 TaxID=454284 RepID=A0A0J6I2C3_COCPO|nr:hypothetical protein CPAG_01828 [Coccidioides posadasii RMSCC 3488]
MQITPYLGVVHHALEEQQSVHGSAPADHQGRRKHRSERWAPSPTPLPHAAWPGLFSTASDNWFAAAWWCHLRRATPKLRFVTFEADRDPVPGEKLIRHIGLCNYHLWP